jgi:hypothetical protein
LKVKEREKEHEAMHIEDTQRLVREHIEMLKVVLYLVRRGEREKSGAPIFTLFEGCE